jgi:hypothetical protein
LEDVKVLAKSESAEDARLVLQELKIQKRQDRSHEKSEIR